MQTIVWSSNLKVKKAIEDALDNASINLMDWEIETTGSDVFKLPQAFNAYFKWQESISPDPEYKIPAIHKRMAFASDVPGLVVKDMLSLAEHAKTNPAATEQNVFITGYKDNNKACLKLTAVTQYLRIDKEIIPETVADLSGNSYSHTAQISSGPIRSLLKTISDNISNHTKVKYLDFMIDPSTRSGLAIMLFIGRMAEPADESEEGPPATASDEELDAADTHEFLICAYLNAKFDMAENRFPDLRNKLEIITPMNRGLKGQIKAMSRLSESLHLTITDLETHMATKGLHITLWSLDREGNKLQSLIAQIPAESLTNEAIIKYTDKTYDLDANLIATAINNTKGDLSVGLSEKIIAIISDDTIAATAVKITAVPENKIEEELESNVAPNSNASNEPLDVNETLETMRVESHIDKATEGLPETSCPRAFSEKMSMDKPLSITDVPIGYGEVHMEKGNGGDFTVIEIANAVAKGEYYECYMPTEKVLVKIAAKFINCQDPVAPLRIKRGSITHRTLEVLESTPDRVYSSESLRECVGALMGTVKQPTFNAAIGKMAADGLIDRQSRGKYKHAPLAKYVLFDTL